MRRTLATMVALGALALAPAPASQASEGVISATLSPASAQRAAPVLLPAPAAVSPLRAPVAGAAQAPKRLSGLYLGGATGRYVQFVSLRLNRQATRATERATLVVRCSGDPSIRSVLDNLTLAQISVSDGSAKGSAVLEEDIPPSVPTIGGLSRRGVVNFRVRVGTLGRAAGTLRSRFTLTDPASGATRARCDSGTVRWSARIAPRDAGRGRPAAVGRSGYFGTTDQRLPFLLEVLPGGRAVRPAGMTFRASCPSLRGLPLDLVSTVRMPIGGGAQPEREGRSAAGTLFRRAPDRGFSGEHRTFRGGKPKVRGRFGATGRLTRQFSSDEFGPVTENYVWRLRGRFGAEGVAGSWRVTGTVVREADGVEVGTCTTGRNRWRAVR